MVARCHRGLNVFIAHILFNCVRAALRKCQQRRKSERALISPEGRHFAHYQPHHHLSTGEPETAKLRAINAW